MFNVQRGQYRKYSEINAKLKDNEMWILPKTKTKNNSCKLKASISDIQDLVFLQHVTV